MAPDSSSNSRADGGGLDWWTPPTNPQRSWPQAKKYSQWPSDAPNKGKIGDPVFDYFAKTELDFPRRTTWSSFLPMTSCSW